MTRQLNSILYPLELKYMRNVPCLTNWRVGRVSDEPPPPPSDTFATSWYLDANTEGVYSKPEQFGVVL